MPTYLSLLSFTKEGVEKIKDSPSRLDAGKKAFEAAGGKIISAYALLGQYDMAVLVEAPDDLTFARLGLALAAKGNVRTESMRAFNEDEYRKIISGIS
ncbi:MAG TPA: GYD domain-containing protein [Acidobacteriaceae bacterium]|nr:GYD domain-containing protein [Acidobacteriaceae bacterium]